jgi:hypothetical protein
MARRISRPVSLIVATILVVYGYGIPPFLPSINVPRVWVLFAVAALPFSGSIDALRGENGDVPFLFVFITLFLCVFTMASVFWAYVGHNEGRIVFLGFVTLNFLWWTFLVITAMGVNDDGVEQQVTLGLSLVRPVIWIVCLWIYFTKSDVVAYYKQEDQKVTNG